MCVGLPQALDRTTMSELAAEFEQAASDVQKLPHRPDNDILLRLYALYKQASHGDACGPKPGFFDFVGTAKYEAWSQLRGMSGDEARRKYVELVRELATRQEAGNA